MKRLAALVAFAAVLGAGAAFADTIENGYGNTFVVADGSGQVVHYHFNADGTFAAATPDGQPAGGGAWEVADGQICLTPTGGERGCTEYVGDKNVGDTWTQAGMGGAQITITLQAGR
jgi:hypothetical protein